MILVLTNERDLTSDYVILELQRRSIPYFRLNSEHLAAARVRYLPVAGKQNWELDFPNRLLRLEEISAAYFRRPAAPLLSGTVQNVSERAYCASEWGSALRSIYSALGDLWLNSPAKIALAEDKPRQLSVAVAVGLQIPETVITNDASVALNFISAGPTIAKTLYSAVLEGDEGAKSERVIFTNRISNRSFPLAAIEAAPVIFQREIPKALDIRVTVVGERVFAAGIASQVREETSVDWRRGSHPDLPHAIHNLPSKIAERCVAIVRSLGLRFAAIDLVLDPHGAYWFLEANPNGQWAWIENRTGLQIASAIVDELYSISSPRKPE